MTLNVYLCDITLTNDAPTQPAPPSPSTDPNPADLEIGEAAYGGFMGGFISTTQDGNATHALIVSDADLLALTYAWKDDLTETPGAASIIDGPSNFAAMSVASHPIASAVKTTLNDASHGGYSDWYIPAICELDILYQNLKPTTDNNDTGSAIDNPYAVPSRVAADRTAGSPAQTSVVDFQSGGYQAFSAVDFDLGGELYASSTQINILGWSARAVSFFDGLVTAGGVIGDFAVRAIRRVAL